MLDSTLNSSLASTAWIPHIDFTVRNRYDRQQFLAIFRIYLFHKISQIGIASNSSNVDSGFESRLQVYFSSGMIVNYLIVLTRRCGTSVIYPLSLYLKS